MMAMMMLFMHGIFMMMTPKFTMVRSVDDESDDGDDDDDDGDGDGDGGVFRC